MARVTPFHALRYARPDGDDISALTAPPYDVIDEARRAELLARDPHNVVALELPEGPTDPAAPGNRYEIAAARWREWQEEGVLVRDRAPALYVIEQRFKSGSEERSRRAFVAAVALEPFSAGVVLPHELTLPKAIDDRLNITRATAANLSPVLGLFDDEGHRADALLAKVAGLPPIARCADDDGVLSLLWALTDPADHAAFADLLGGRAIIIADGHHRYSTALVYRDERRATASAVSGGNAAYDRVMMALVSLDDPGLAVSPTHRVADASGPFDVEAFWTALEGHFALSELPAGHPAGALSSAAGPTFMVRTRGGTTRIASLRNDVSHGRRFPADASKEWRALDTAVLQELVLRPLLDIHPERPETLDRLSYTKDAHEALAAASSHDVVFIMNPTPIAQVSELALSGEMMPQKSTYFAPKLPSGLLFRSLD